MIYRMLFLLFAFHVFAANEAKSTAPKKPRVCLDMIVKNESAVIEQCLNSVKHWIDYWVICDTGSTDGTQEIIQRVMKGYPGELHERPWVDFAHNRNEALDYAREKGDYILLIDADEILKEPPNYIRPTLDKDCYAICVKNPMASSVYQRGYLLGMHVDWKWKGVLHEGLVSEKAKSCGIMNDLLLDYNTKGGARTRDPNKYKKDVAVFLKALETEPDNSRYMYYLGQSYHCDGDYENALETFRKRITMGGEDGEVYYSLYMIATLEDHFEYPIESVVDSYCKAYTYRPTRAEPVFRLAQYYNRIKDFQKGYMMSRLAMSIPEPVDMVNMEKWIYEYGALSEMAHSAFWLGRILEAGDCYEKLLVKNLPEDAKKLVEYNLEQVKVRTSGESEE